MKIKLTDDNTKRGGSESDWLAVAGEVVNNKYHKADKSTLESIYIGLRGFTSLSGAADKVSAMLKKKK